MADVKKILRNILSDNKNDQDNGYNGFDKITTKKDMEKLLSEIRSINFADENKLDRILHSLHAVTLGLHNVKDSDESVMDTLGYLSKSENVSGMGIGRMTQLASNLVYRDATNSEKMNFTAISVAENLFENNKDRFNTLTGKTMLANVAKKATTKEQLDKVLNLAEKFETEDKKQNRANHKSMIFILDAVANNPNAKKEQLEKTLEQFDKITPDRNFNMNDSWSAASTFIRSVASRSENSEEEVEGIINKIKSEIEALQNKNNNNNNNNNNATENMEAETFEFLGDDEENENTTETSNEVTNIVDPATEQTENTNTEDEDEFEEIEFSSSNDEETEEYNLEATYAFWKNYAEEKEHNISEPNYDNGLAFDIEKPDTGAKARLEYENGGKKVKMLCDAKNPANADYFVQVLKEAQKRGLNKVNLNSPKSPEFVARMKEAAESLGMEILINKAPINDYENSIAAAANTAESAVENTAENVSTNMEDDQVEDTNENDLQTLIEKKYMREKFEGDIKTQYPNFEAFYADQPMKDLYLKEDQSNNDADDDENVSYINGENEDFYAWKTKNGYNNIDKENNEEIYRSLKIEEARARMADIKGQSATNRNNTSEMMSNIAAQNRSAEM